MDEPPFGNPYWMIEQPVSREDIQAINPEKLLGYLKAKGWECERQGRGERAMWWCLPLPFAEKFYIIDGVRIPVLNHWADYERRMMENVSVICQAEGRLAADILLDIEAADPAPLGHENEEEKDSSK